MILFSPRGLGYYIVEIMGGHLNVAIIGNESLSESQNRVSLVYLAVSRLGDGLYNFVWLNVICIERFPVLRFK